MKNSTDQLQNAVEQQQCSEEKCATCFENRGCIYEQLGAALLKMEDQLKESHEKSTTEQLSKRA